MRIGVLGKFQFSMFSGSQANVTLAVAETLRIQGHETYLVNSCERMPWWDDITSMKEEWKDKIVHWKDIETNGIAQKFELLLELVVAVDRIGRHADNNRLGLGEFRFQAVKIDGLLGAAGGVVLGVKIQNDLLALEG